MKQTRILAVAVAGSWDASCGPSQVLVGRPSYRVAPPSGAHLSPIETDSADSPQCGPTSARRRNRSSHAPVPTLVYVLEGAIDVETDGGLVHMYKAGDSFLMVVNTWTNAKNSGTMPAKMLVVLSG